METLRSTGTVQADDAQTVPLEKPEEVAGSAQEQHLRQALNDAEREMHYLNALCIDYTAAYCCDLISDEMEPIKKKEFSHCATNENTPERCRCYSKWIRTAYDDFIIHESAPDYLEVFDNANLMKRLEKEEYIVYRHQTLPNQAGMQYFEARAVRLYADADSYKIILGYRPIDAMVAEERQTRKRLEEAARAAQEASNAKSAFLFNMSHDIRTPMNAIIGYTELLKQNGQDAEKRTDYINKIENSSQYLLSLLNDVLEMARIESGKAKLEETAEDASVIMEELACVFEDLMAKKGITFKRAFQVQHCCLYCDAVKLKEVMLNILSNAYKYTQPGGCVEYRLEELPSGTPGTALYRATVKDTGIGMSKEFLATIFDSFTRERTSTESGQSGTGLGMAITKKLIDLMGGTITIESEVGRGTTVTATFPHRLAEPIAAPEALSRPERTASFAGRRVLLAEDNDLNAEIAVELLKLRGLTVDRARDGRECVAAVEQHPDGFYDLILMDIQMPEMDGYAAAAAIRAMGDCRAARTPIIAMTANAFEEDRQKALRMGMNAHIAKPIDVDKLLQTLEDFL